MKYWFCIAVLALLYSCEYFKKDEPKTPIARVNETYLFAEDIRVHFGDNFGEDSAQVVNNYINRWATQQLLINKAKINLPITTQEEFNKLVEQYKTDLYTETYKSNIVSLQLDSTITKAELITYYERNKENFKLNDELFKIRYVHVENDFTDIDQVKALLLDFETSDIKKLEEKKLQFKSVNLNDSTWIKKENLIKTIPILKDYGKEVLKKGYFGHLQDSIGVYLVKIEDVLTQNDIAPLSYVAPTIEQIILNRRKQELVKKLEKDITTDAIKNNNFEIYANDQQ